MANPSTRDLATDIVGRLQAAGFAAFWVGGCVRDFLLGRAPGDYDIATNALPKQIEKLFPRTIAVGRKFGVMVVLEAKQQFQVATFRAESDYRDGRRPETVSFGDARADALRRDFTINGLFFDPVAGKSHDWVGGEADLRAGIIRTIGAPEERFAEDHLRMLRAIRFAARFGFEIEPQTFAAVKTHASKIELISAERIRDELIKLFAPPEGVGRASSPSSNAGFQPAGSAQRAAPGGKPAIPYSLEGCATACLAGNAPFPISSSSSFSSSSKQREIRERGRFGPGNFRPDATAAARGLELLRASGLLEPILPELAATATCDQSPDFHPEGTVFTHLRLMLEKMPPDSDPLLPWAVLMHDIAKPLTASRDPQTGSIHFYEHEKIGAKMTEEILERLRFPRKQIEPVSETVLHHMQFKDALKMRKSTVRRILLRETFPLELQLHRLDCLGSHGKLDVYDFLVAQSAELAHQPEIHPPLLTGAELIKLGMKPGPAMGRLLAEIREKQLADELKTKAAARAWAKAWRAAQPVARSSSSVAASSGRRSDGG